jgi:multifunctional beta-oxidation protein
LAKEGAKYHIHCNVLAPGAASRLTATVWPPEMMDVMNPGYVVPLVAFLVHPSCKESGSIFEAGAGHFSKIRWERSRGFIARPDDSLTAELVLRNHSKIMDFTNAEHPTEVADSMALLERAMAQPSGVAGNQLSFRGRVVLVTGGGEGLGRAYAKHFAQLGAKVVVNDIKNAEKVANDIRSAKGEATALTMSVEEGEAVVKSVVDTYGRIDILVNNAGKPPSCLIIDTACPSLYLYVIETLS